MTKTTGTGQVVLRDLSRSYMEGGRRHDVIRALSAEFTSGETVALRGRSGSGKSTLLNLISGIDVPDAGTVLVSGQDVTAMSERERTLFRRANIGFIYQAFNLVPTLTVGDNVRLVLELNGAARTTATRRVAELLGEVGLADRSESYPDVLSGGEQQRVAIARALANDPVLLLADEPTGNLDERTADKIIQLLDRLVGQAGGTMILATHSAAVASCADRVLALSDGTLAG